MKASLCLHPGRKVSALEEEERKTKAGKMPSTIATALHRRTHSSRTISCPMQTFCYSQFDKFLPTHARLGHCQTYQGGHRSRKGNSGTAFKLHYLRKRIFVSCNIRNKMFSHISFNIIPALLPLSNLNEIESYVNYVSFGKENRSTVFTLNFQTKTK